MAAHLSFSCISASKLHREEIALEFIELHGTILPSVSEFHEGTKMQLEGSEEMKPFSRQMETLQAGGQVMRAAVCFNLPADFQVQPQVQ